VRDVDALRTRLALAMFLGLPACDGSDDADPVTVSFAKISGGRSDDDEKKDDGETADGGSGGADSGGSTTGPSKPQVDPVEFCRTGEMTYAKSDADSQRRPGTGEALGCPRSITASGGYPNLALRENATQLLRDAGDDEHCCYEDEPPPPPPPIGHIRKGRPLALGGAEWLPAVRLETRGDAAVDDARARAAAAWVEDARAEHASIASFERAARELEMIGAPEALVRACRCAAEDERRHTRTCLGIAEALSGGRVELGELPAVTPRPGGLPTVLSTTFVEGAVAETIAALVAARAARRTNEPKIRDALRVIADEEAQHAALAWRTVAWGLARLEPRAREAWLAWARQYHAPRETTSGPWPAAAHGRLDAAEEAAIAEEAWARCIAPLLEALAYGQLPEVTMSPETGTPLPPTSLNANGIDWQ
jgi:hypothetical protein